MLRSGAGLRATGEREHLRLQMLLPAARAEAREALHVGKSRHQQT